MSKRRRIEVVAKWLGRFGMKSTWTVPAPDHLRGRTLGGLVYALDGGSVATDGGALYWAPEPTEDSVLPGGTAIVSRKYIALCNAAKRHRAVPRWPNDLRQRDVVVKGHAYDSRYVALARYLLGRDARFALVADAEAMARSKLSASHRILVMRSARGAAVIMPLRMQTREVLAW